MRCASLRVPCLELLTLFPAATPCSACSPSTFPPKSREITPSPYTWRPPSTTPTRTRSCRSRRGTERHSGKRPQAIISSCRAVFLSSAFVYYLQPLFRCFLFSFLFCFVAALILSIHKNLPSLHCCCCSCCSCCCRRRISTRATCHATRNLEADVAACDGKVRAKKQVTCAGARGGMHGRAAGDEPGWTAPVGRRLGVDLEAGPRLLGTGCGV